MMKNIIIIILTCITVNTIAQNVAVDLNKVRTTFLEAKQLGFEVEVYHFQTNTSKGELISKAIMRKSGKNYYSSFRSDKMIVNEKKGTIIIDEENQEISYFENDQYTKKPEQLQIPDSLLLQFKFIEKKGTSKVYEYTDANPLASIIKTQLIISSNSTIEKVVYFYNKDTKKVSYDAYKVELHYKNVITENISSNYFDITNYITFSNNKPLLSKKYSTYTLLN